MNGQFDPYGQWLKIPAARRPPSYYEMVDAPRFAPGRGHLVDAVRAARQYLEARAADAGPAGPHVQELLAELEDAETALSGPSAFQHYHRPILAQLDNDYVRHHGNDNTLWDLRRLRRWLEDEKRVHPDRAQAIVFGMCEPKIEAWDQLLAELFPTSGRADIQRRESQLAGLREEGPDESTRSARGDCREEARSISTFTRFPSTGRTRSSRNTTFPGEVDAKRASWPFSPKMPTPGCFAMPTASCARISRSTKSFSSSAFGGSVRADSPKN